MGRKSHNEKKEVRRIWKEKPIRYENNNKLMTDIRNKREKEELLIKRRQKLARLLEEERRRYDVELMIHKTKSMAQKATHSKLDDIPTEVLKDVNVGLKLEEDRRRRHEAETKLYHQWRKNNPIVRQYESKYRCKDLKLSWLDRKQIEKQMQKEKDEQECKRVVKKRDERLKKEKEKEERRKKDLKGKREELKANLDHQMSELRRKKHISEELRKKLSLWGC